MTKEPNELFEKMEEHYIEVARDLLSKTESCYVDEIPDIECLAAVIGNLASDYQLLSEALYAFIKLKRDKK